MFLVLADEEVNDLNAMSNERKERLVQQYTVIFRVVLDSIAFLDNLTSSQLRTDSLSLYRGKSVPIFFQLAVGDLRCLWTITESGSTITTHLINILIPMWPINNPLLALF